MPRVRLLTTAEAPAKLLTEVRALLDGAFAGDFTDDDWAHSCGGRHVVVTEGGTVVAHAAVVPRELRVAGVAFRTGYVEGVGALVARQRAGLGSLATARATQLVRDEYQLGALSTGRPAFYRRVGWESWAGPTFVRRGTATVRTPEEDDGVMVLRHGPSAAVDLGSPLSCEARTGDDW